MAKQRVIDVSLATTAKVAQIIAATALIVSASACVGRVGETGSERRARISGGGSGGNISSTTDPATPTNGDGQTSFSCDPAAHPAAEQLRRLTVTQYRNTVAGLTTWALGTAAAGTALMNELAGPLGTLPADQREPVPQDLHGSYRRLDQSLQQEHVDGFYAVGVALGQALTKSDRLGTVVGKCATDTDASNDANCLSTFITRFGAKALRRPLSADETTFYKSVYGTDSKASAAAYADVIAVMANAPQFLYMVEHGETATPDKASVFELSAFELASRLSYQFWETAPDDELLLAASDGSLLDADVLDRQIERLYADARTRSTVGGFVADWLKVEDVPQLDAHNDDATFRTFAGSDLPDATLRQQMIDDVLGMVDYYVWAHPGSVEDLLTSNLSFNKGAKLAKIYGVGPWDGQSEPPAFADGQRPGLLTRALFLTSGSANTRPIQKGVFIRRRMLCDDLPPPPAGANAVPPQLRSDMTTRQVVEELTEKPGTVCATCHTTMINPLGFATENFDALGRERSAQRLFDAAGKEVGTQPVDTHSTPQVNGDDSTSSSGAADMTHLVAQSGKAQACLARNYFRFSYARWENLELDGCTLESLRQRLASGGQIADMLKEVARSSGFRQRAFE